MATLQRTRFFTVSIGAFELRFWGDDRHAQNVAERWVRLFWARASSQASGWSVATIIHTENPEVTIYKHPASEAHGTSSKKRRARVDHKPFNFGAEACC